MNHSNTLPLPSSSSSTAWLSTALSNSRRRPHITNACQWAIDNTRWIQQQQQYNDDAPEEMTRQFEIGSQGLSDKHDDDHRFFYAYQPYLSKIIWQKLRPYCFDDDDDDDNNDNHRHDRRRQRKKHKPKLKFMEIGLGCGINGGIKDHTTPGGSVLGWTHLFRNLSSVLDFELHVIEYDQVCATQWQQQEYAARAGANNDTATRVHIHIGDASSSQDLYRIVNETGSSHDFDVIIDDGSHINWQQIKTLHVLIDQVQLGGIYVVEDVISSCINWKANIGTTEGRLYTGGTWSDCMTASYLNGTSTGPSFFSKVVEWQRSLAKRRPPFDSVNHIDFHWSLVVLEKALPQRQTKFIRQQRRTRRKRRRDDI